MRHGETCTAEAELEIHEIIQCILQHFYNTFNIIDDGMMTVGDTYFNPFFNQIQHRVNHAECMKDKDYCVVLCQSGIFNVSLYKYTSQKPDVYMFAFTKDVEDMDKKLLEILQINNVKVCDINA